MRTAAIAATVFLLGAASADAMLMPATDSGWRAQPAADCNWKCLKKKKPKRTTTLRGTLREMADLGGEPNSAMYEQQRKLMELQVHQQQQQQMLETLTNLLKKHNEIALSIIHNLR